MPLVHIHTAIVLLYMEFVGRNNINMPLVHIHTAIVLLYMEFAGRNNINMPLVHIHTYSHSALVSMQQTYYCVLIQHTALETRSLEGSWLLHHTRLCVSSSASLGTLWRQEEDSKQYASLIARLYCPAVFHAFPGSTAQLFFMHSQALLPSCFSCIPRLYCPAFFHAFPGSTAQLYSCIPRLYCPAFFFAKKAGQ